MDACLRQGIKPKDLIRVKREKIKEVYSQEIKIDEKNLKIFEAHFEDRRKKKVEMLIEVREEILEEERLGLWKPGTLNSVNLYIIIIIKIYSLINVGYRRRKFKFK